MYATYAAGVTQIPDCLLTSHVRCHFHQSVREQTSSFIDFFPLRTIYANSYQGGCRTVARRGQDPDYSLQSFPLPNSTLQIVVVNRDCFQKSPPDRESPNEARKALLAVLEPIDVAKDSEVQKSGVPGAYVLVQYPVQYIHTYELSRRASPRLQTRRFSRLQLDNLLAAAGGVVGPLESGQISWCNFAAPKPPSLSI